MKKDEALFTLIPKTGFYKCPNKMAYLNKVDEYSPHGAEAIDIDGYVSFTYYPKVPDKQFHVRLWSNASDYKKLCAQFDIETTSEGETSVFWFMVPCPSGCWLPLNKISVEGSKRVTLEVEFDLDQYGGAHIGMCATKMTNPSNIFLLRKIQVFPVR